MTTTANPLRFRLNNVRASFPVLFKGEQYMGKGNYRCGTSLIIPPDHPQYKQVLAAIDAAAEAKWKDKAAAQLKVARSKDKICLRDGDLKSKYDGYAGNWILSANCQGGETEAECAKPVVYSQFADPATGRPTVVTQAQNKIYSGCYVNAVVEFYGDSRFDTAVNCSLSGIQFHADGDAFGSVRASPDEFEGTTVGADAEEFA